MQRSTVLCKSFARSLPAARSVLNIAAAHITAPIVPITVSRASTTVLCRSFASIPKYDWGVPIHLKVGDECSLVRTFNASDVKNFGTASGDWNPVHYPDLFDATKKAEIDKWKSNPATKDQPLPKGGIFRFPGPLVHGMLTSSLIGTLFASHMPGAIYLSQNLKFVAPVFYDETVTARIQVVTIDRKKVVCRTWVEKVDPKDKKSAIVVVEGDASVLVENLAQPKA